MYTDDATYAHFFLLRISMLTRDIDIAILSVRLSIRPSIRHVLVLYRNDAMCRYTFFSTRNPIILVLRISKY